MKQLLTGLAVIITLALTAVFGAVAEIAYDWLLTAYQWAIQHGIIPPAQGFYIPQLRPFFAEAISGVVGAAASVPLSCLLVKRASPFAVGGISFFMLTALALAMPGSSSFFGIFGLIIGWAFGYLVGIGLSLTPSPRSREA
jgi:hypothetical protein